MGTNWAPMCADQFFILFTRQNLSKRFYKKRKISSCGLQSTFYWLSIVFTSLWRIFHSYGDVTIVGEGLQNLGARHSGPLSREGSLSCHTCCDTGPRFFRSHSKDRSVLSPPTTRKWDAGDFSTGLYWQSIYRLSVYVDSILYVSLVRST